MAKRNTNQRKAIRDVFTATDRPLSTQEVLDAAQTHKPGLGIATVYRTIKLLLNEGWLSTVRLPGESPRYEIAGKPHHHHFYCNACGRLRSSGQRATTRCSCSKRLYAGIPRSGALWALCGLHGPE